MKIKGVLITWVKTNPETKQATSVKAVEVEQPYEFIELAKERIKENPAVLGCTIKYNYDDMKFNATVWRDIKQ